jgi:hypothetical protein
LADSMQIHQRHVGKVWTTDWLNTGFEPTCSVYRTPTSLVIMSIERKKIVGNLNERSYSI